MTRDTLIGCIKARLHELGVPLHVCGFKPSAGAVDLLMVIGGTERGVGARFRMAMPHSEFERELAKVAERWRSARAAAA